MSDEIRIHSQINDYSVYFVDELNDLISTIQSDKAIYIIDSNVAELYAETFGQLDQHRVLSLEASEELKTLDGAGAIFDFFLEHSVNKKSEIYAIGGGIIQDVVTLATHLFHRGVQWTYIPTTLLAMSDSCIGAKAAINYKSFKNPLGVFHPPKAILLYPKFINTLQYEDLLSGYGEIIKLNLIGGQHLDLLKEINENSLLIDGQVSTHVTDTLIKSSLLIKKAYIEEDEFDVGVRRILNYGHTFGHALEVMLNYVVPHGQAVVIGIDIVNAIAVELDCSSQAAFLDARACYDQLYAGKTFQAFSLDGMMSKIGKDKKVVDGQILLALMKEPGDFLLHRVAIQTDLRQLAIQYLQQNNLFDLKAA